MIKNKQKKSGTELQLGSALTGQSKNRAGKNRSGLEPETKVRNRAREVTFAVYRPDAQRVFLSGHFNGWSTEATPLTAQPNRDWQTTVVLPPGNYEYKFVIDGEWMIDPRSSSFTLNGFGTLNSVIEVKA